MGVGELDAVGAGVDVAVCDGIAVGALVGLDVGELVDAGVNEGEDVGAVADEPLKTTLGLWLFASVMLKELVVSLTLRLTVPAFWEITEKLACPFCA